MPKLCSIDHCAKKASTKGWCRMHYTRWLRHGDPTKTIYAPPGAPMEEKLRRGLGEFVPGECWEWKGFRDNNGYGRVGRASLASREAYKTWVGEIPEGMHVCHTCDNPPCCNPDHLFIGTAKDNCDDKVSKGRHTWGENHPNHWLTDGQVDEIRALHAQGLSQTKIARLFGCSQPYVGELVRFEKRRNPSNLAA